MFGEFDSNMNRRQFLQYSGGAGIYLMFIPSYIKTVVAKGIGSDIGVLPASLPMSLFSYTLSDTRMMLTSNDTSPSAVSVDTFVVRETTLLERLKRIFTE